MALEATHLRFAHDLKERLHVQHLDEYFSGAIYPDSRYITKLERRLTHPRDFLEWNLESINDFRKGWFTHLLCDELQRTIVKNRIPAVDEGTPGQGGEIWIKHTALKILQDMDDVKKFDIAFVLPKLIYTEQPNQENPNTLLAYNQLFQNLYAVPAIIDTGSYYQLWKDFGLNEDPILQLGQQVSVYRQDRAIMDRVQEIYQETLLNVAI